MEKNMGQSIKTWNIKLLPHIARKHEENTRILPHIARKHEGNTRN